MLEIQDPEKEMFPRCAQAPYIDFGSERFFVELSGGATV
jgi:hypothetical protein